MASRWNKKIRFAQDYYLPDMVLSAFQAAVIKGRMTEDCSHLETHNSFMVSPR
jgi:hypothetical protein